MGIFEFIKERGSYVDGLSESHLLRSSLSKVDDRVAFMVGIFRYEFALAHINCAQLVSHKLLRDHDSILNCWSTASSAPTWTVKIRSLRFVSPVSLKMRTLQSSQRPCISPVYEALSFIP